jgi:hypothetical protein
VSLQVGGQDFNGFCEAVDQLSAGLRISQHDMEARSFFHSGFTSVIGGWISRSLGTKRWLDHHGLPPNRKIKQTSKITSGRVWEFK